MLAWPAEGIATKLYASSNVVVCAVATGVVTAGVEVAAGVVTAGVEVAAGVVTAGVEVAAPVEAAGVIKGWSYSPPHTLNRCPWQKRN